MFDLVADIERYPEFVPLCAGLRIRQRVDEPESGRVRLVADMTVAFKLMRETFTSQVELDRKAGAIVAHYLDGPFRSLENRWRFRDLPPSGEAGGAAGGAGSNLSLSEGAAASAVRSEVDFFLSYELKSRALQVLAGAVFDRAFSHFAEAFERRADVIYGRGR